MHHFILTSFIALYALTGFVSADEPDANKAIADMKNLLVGQWLAVEGMPKSDEERIWKIGDDNKIIDNQEKILTHYSLVQSAEGEIWTVMFYERAPFRPMIMRVKIEEDKMRLDHISLTKDGKYGAVTEKGIGFTRK